MVTHNALAKNVKNIIDFYAFMDKDSEGLRRTPERVVKAFDEIFAGYKQDPQEVFTTFDADGCDQLVLLDKIPFYSMCEHHMLPFYGTASIAYIPNDRVIGISKLARLLEIYARRLQIQERIGEQITDDLMKYLQPKGAACVLHATHMCMQMRGVRSQGSVMTTSSLKGCFLDEASARAELFQIIGGK